MENKSRRYAMFGSLYFSQGTILSYFTALNALYFLDRGLSMTDVGIFASIALIPFVIKILWGILSDKVNLFGLGHRKPYILIGLTLQFACLIVVPFIDPAEYYWWFVALAFVLQMGMALYDTCTDGYALDTTPKEEQGTIQGFMVGGRALGVVGTASVVGLLADQVSWLAVFWLLAVFTLIPIPFVFSIREAERPVDRAFDWGAFAAFKQRSVIALAGLGFIFFHDHCGDKSTCQSIPGAGVQHLSNPSRTVHDCLGDWRGSGRGHWRRADPEDRPEKRHPDCLIDLPVVWVGAGNHLWSWGSLADRGAVWAGLRHISDGLFCPVNEFH